MKSIKINPIVSKFTRTNSNRITIKINNTGEVLLTAPKYASIYEINKLIEDKFDWISKKKVYILSKQIPKKKFINGEKFLYLGKECELKIIPANKNAIQYFDNNFLLSENCIEYAEQYFIALYKNLAWNYLANKTVELAKKYNFNVTNIKINSAKTKWGSCSSKNGIIYSWNLIMAPSEVIDYVIVHELCHTIHKNHSKDFWELVSQITPKYKEYILFLKNNGHLFNI